MRPHFSVLDSTLSARRVGLQGYGVMLAEVGLPPGADVDRAALGTHIDIQLSKD
ncbi:MAG: hypothetical protein WAN35_13485 [Terracidiphilus sp.]